MASYSKFPQRLTALAHWSSIHLRHEAHQSNGRWGDDGEHLFDIQPMALGQVDADHKVGNLRRPVFIGLTQQQVAAAAQQSHAIGFEERRRTRGCGGYELDLRILVQAEGIDHAAGQAVEQRRTNTVAAQRG